MRFSEQWLREWADPNIDTDTLCEWLTMGGLEVEDVKPAGPECDSVVVVRVIAVDSSADKPGVKVCTLALGKDQTATIVCDAVNVYSGMITALAGPGVVLPSGVRVETIAPGRLCSERDLGLTEVADRIIELDTSFVVGQPLNEFLDSADTVIDIAVTPNRGDCLSIKGVAREVATLTECAFHVKDIEVAGVTSDLSREVRLEASRACPKYLGRIIADVDCGKQSPFWLREKLRRSGVRAIRAVVDITNYGMLELGQPLHVFDQDKLTGAITVRYPQKGERLTLLNEAECALRSETLIVADEQGPVALAGIIGGLGCAVAADSRNIFLECAYFSPEAIIGQARRYGLHTDSAHRFERGVDSQLQADAIERATCLMVSICGGRPGPVLQVQDEANLPQASAIHLRLAQVARVMGLAMSRQQIQGILDRLGVQHHWVEEGWMVTPNSHRFDLKVEADLIEELARIAGYENIPPATPHVRLAIRSDNTLSNRLITSRSVLVQHGYQEVVTFSFVDPEIQDLLDLGMNSMRLANPIAPELSHMRVSLWPGLLATACYNVKRQQQRVRLFETGPVFTNEPQLSQNHYIAGIAIGDYYDNQWDIPYKSCDLYDIKADMQAWLSTLGLDVHYLAIRHGSLHPGQAAGVYCGKTRIGQFGRLHPRISAALGLPEACYLFEFNAKKMHAPLVPTIRPLSRFPVVKRDLSVEIGEDVPIAEVMRNVRAQGQDNLHGLELFDVYQGDGLSSGKKSIALGLTFQKTSSTLEDKEVELMIGEIVSGLEQQFGAKLRE